MSDIFEILDGTPDDNFYLTLNEESTYIDVFCDGYVVKLYAGSQSQAGWIYTADNIYALGQLNAQIVFGATVYFLNKDPNTTLELLENTPTRVVIRQSGNWYEIAGPSYRDTDDIVVYTWYIYSDRFFLDTKWVVNSDASVGNFPNINKILGFNGFTYFTGEVSIYEDSGSEIIGGGSQNNSDYIGKVANELNIQAVTIYVDQSANWSRYLTGDEIATGWNNCTILSANSPYRACIGWIIDSQEREYGQKKYTETERLEMGDQYKDVVIQ